MSDQETLISGPTKEKDDSIGQRPTFTSSGSFDDRVFSFLLPRTPTPTPQVYDGSWTVTVQEVPPTPSEDLVSGGPGPAL